MDIPVILVIEDSVADVNVLRYALHLHSQDYRLEVLRDGNEALRYIHDHRTGMRRGSPCVIVLDLQLPYARGLEILRAIREAPALSEVKVVVLAGVASPSDQAAIAFMGASYREKPLSLEGYIELGGEILSICKEEPRPAAA